ncbi:MAG: hypothetical protein A2622_08035 [Bdellovibrionales bacterium RIFCSPHIGHO2_01_FULL_40_29]|nr:MAG: hypothetical protein A2622_08035 [Bdellovibrionales bacterium RIFCSPHIGHO2_01_FULL_40_29]
MKTLKWGLFYSAIVVVFFSCTAKNKSVDENEFSIDSEIASAESDLSLSEADEFAEFDESESAPAESADASASNESALENELDSIAAAETPAAEPPPPEPIAEAPPMETSPSMDIPAPEVAADVAPPAEALDPSVAETSSTTIGEISSLQYQGNQSGGTVVINSTQPIQFTTRMNSATNQLVVEVQNSIVPSKLKRSLNTKDMASSIGSVDIYQKSKSKVARFVIQLRPGSPEPLVQPEGNSLLIVGSGNPSYAGASSSGSVSDTGGSSESQQTSTESEPMAAQVHDVNADLTSAGIMDSQSLEDFMASNNKFYGKKISIEAVKLDINEAFKFISDESGVNLIVDEDVTGDVTLKLRQVPWDQAFVLILKTKKLGYKRQGNVIRVGSIATLTREEEEAIKLKDSKLSSEPLMVRRFFIGYADITELEKKIKEFIANTTISATGQISQALSRGKVISDLRTSSLIVTETNTNMAKVEKLIAALDSQPQQVLIEGKVVEAQEKFVHSMGVSWGTPALGAADGAPTGNVIRPSLSFLSGMSSTIFNPVVGIGSVGRPGDLGNLTAQLSLGEKEDKLRVLSAPRISVLTNQRATIAQTVNVSIIRSTTVSPDTGAITSTMESLPVGVSLEVTPQVSNEGTVVMDLAIERSFPGSTTSAEIEKRNAKTKVIVRSGQTAVIGGIFQADAFESTAGIPFFKDIPIFGTLFRGQTKTKNKNELVIFVTPRILKPVLGDPAATSTIE